MERIVEAQAQAQEDMYTLGYDIGSSSVKVVFLYLKTGRVVVSAFYPKIEMSIVAVQAGRVERNPFMWWRI